MKNYCLRFSAERVDRSFLQIMQQLTRGKRYRYADCTAKQFAEELQMTPREIAAVVARQTGDNFRTLVNKYRLRDAREMLRSPRYAHLTVEEIGLMVGYASRQAFYIAFSKAYEETPLHYRQAHTSSR